MKLLFPGAALLAAVALPAAAQAATTSSSMASAQSVYKSVATTEIVNSDGSVTEIHVVTRYYVFGVE